MKRIHVFVLVAFFCSATLFSQTNSKDKARFIYGFTHYINWPEQSGQGMFRIGVFGSFELYKQISDETLGRSVGSQNIETMNVSRQDQLTLTNYHILVVGEKHCTPEQLESISETLKNRPTLIIAEKDGALQYGAGIDFANNYNGKIGFRYSAPNLEKNGLKASKQLSILAISAL